MASADNPFLSGMLGGMQLAVATRGAQLEQQQATFNNMLKLQQMQLEAARGERTFQLEQARLVASTRLSELQYRSETEKAVAAVEKAKLMAPVESMKSQAEMMKAQAEAATARADLDKLAIGTGAANIKGGFTTMLTGVPPEQQDQVAQGFFGFQRQLYAQLPEGKRDPRALQALGMVETEWKVERQKRSDAAVTLLDSFGPELEKLDGMDSSGEAYKMKMANLGARYRSVVRPALLAAGVDPSQHDAVFSGAGKSGANLGDVTAPGPAKTVPRPTGRDITEAEVLAGGVPTRLAGLDTRLYEASVSPNPTVAAAATNARNRLEAARRATVSGTTGDFGGRRARALTLRDIDTLEQMADPAQINAYLDQFVSPVERQETPEFYTGGY